MVRPEVSCSSIQRSLLIQRSPFRISHAAQIFLQPDQLGPKIPPGGAKVTALQAESSLFGGVH